MIPATDDRASLAVQMVGEAYRTGAVAEGLRMAAAGAVDAPAVMLLLAYADPGAALMIDQLRASGYISGQELDHDRCHQATCSLSGWLFVVVSEPMAAELSALMAPPEAVDDLRRLVRQGVAAGRTPFLVIAGGGILGVLGQSSGMPHACSPADAERARRQMRRRSSGT